MIQVSRASAINEFNQSIFRSVDKTTLYEIRYDQPRVIPVVAGLARMMTHNQISRFAAALGRVFPTARDSAEQRLRRD